MLFPFRPVSKQDQQLIINAIREAENNTSGEIRVHIEKNCKQEVIKQAAFVFEKLGMTNTQQRNGVLIYIAVKDKHFAIIGDKGINEAVPDGFWNNVCDVMKEHLAKGQITQAIITGVLLAGEQLKTFFPHQQNDKNELSDQISFGEN
ncbi:MAG: TPM domain-containing protein [Bacteroidia bacterium]|nr:TPM domain-containing protein [Bacteroidia bacterium]